MHKIPITKTGFEKLSKELSQLKNVALPENARDIEIARGHGDLSENAEYTAAKERQAYLHGRIKELESSVSKCSITEIKRSADGRAVFGSIVAIEDINTGQGITYQLMGPFESDIQENKISVTSPIGKALIGKSVGDEIRVNTPGGVREFEVKDISFE